MYTHCGHLPQRFHALSTFFQAEDLPLHSGTPLIWAVPPPINTHHSYSVKSESSKTSGNIKQWLSPLDPSLFHYSGLAESPVGEKTVTSALPCTFCRLGSWLLWFFLLQQGSGAFWEYYYSPSRLLLIPSRDGDLPQGGPSSLATESRTMSQIKHLSFKMIEKSLHWMFCWHVKQDMEWTLPGSVFLPGGGGALL